MLSSDDSMDYYPVFPILYVENPIFVDANQPAGYKWYQSCPSSDVMVASPCPCGCQSSIPQTQIGGPNPYYTQQYEPPPVPPSYTYTTPGYDSHLLEENRNNYSAYEVCAESPINPTQVCHSPASPSPYLYTNEYCTPYMCVDGSNGVNIPVPNHTPLSYMYPSPYHQPTPPNTPHFATPTMSHSPTVSVNHFSPNIFQTEVAPKLFDEIPVRRTDSMVSESATSARGNPWEELMAIIDRIQDTLAEKSTVNDKRIQGKSIEPNEGTLPYHSEDTTTKFINPLSQTESAHTESVVSDNGIYVSNDVIIGNGSTLVETVVQVQNEVVVDGVDIEPQVLDKNPARNLDLFEEIVNNRDDDDVDDSVVLKLLSISQGCSSGLEYVKAFIDNNSRLEKLFEKRFQETLLCYYYVSGLNKDIGEAVEMWVPTTLQEAIYFATIQESLLEENPSIEIHEVAMSRVITTGMEPDNKERRAESSKEGIFVHVEGTEKSITAQCALEDMTDWLKNYELTVWERRLIEHYRAKTPGGASTFNKAPTSVEEAPIFVEKAAEQQIFVSGINVADLRAPYQERVFKLCAPSLGVRQLINVPPTTRIAYSSDDNFLNVNENNLLIFDFGGLELKQQKPCVINRCNEKVLPTEVQLNAGEMKRARSACGHLRCHSMRSGLSRNSAPQFWEQPWKEHPELRRGAVVIFVFDRGQESSSINEDTSAVAVTPSDNLAGQNQVLRMQWGPGERIKWGVHLVSNSLVDVLLGNSGQHRICELLLECMTLDGNGSFYMMNSLKKQLVYAKEWVAFMQVTQPPSDQFQAFTIYSKMIIVGVYIVGQLVGLLRWIRGHQSEGNIRQPKMFIRPPDPNYLYESLEQKREEHTPMLWTEIFKRSISASVKQGNTLSQEDVTTEMLQLFSGGSLIRNAWYWSVLLFIFDPGVCSCYLVLSQQSSILEDKDFLRGMDCNKKETLGPIILLILSWAIELVGHQQGHSQLSPFKCLNAAVWSTCDSISMGSCALTEWSSGQ